MSSIVTVGIPMDPIFQAFWIRPQTTRGLVDLSEGDPRFDPLFDDPAEPQPSENQRAHSKWIQGKRIGIECPYCGEEVYTTAPTLAHYGKSCPRCGAKHRFDGITIDATPSQRAFAQRTFGKKSPTPWKPHRGTPRRSYR